MSTKEYSFTQQERVELLLLISNKASELSEQRNNFATDQRSDRVVRTVGIINKRIALLREIEIKLCGSANHDLT